MSGCTRLCGEAVWPRGGVAGAGIFLEAHVAHAHAGVAGSSLEEAVAERGETRLDDADTERGEPGPKTGRVIASTRPRRLISPGSRRRTAASTPARRGRRTPRAQDVVRVRGLEGVLHRVVHPARITAPISALAVRRFSRPRRRTAAGSAGFTGTSA